MAPPKPPGRWWITLLTVVLVAGILASFFSGHFLRRGWDGYSYLATIRALGAIEEDPGRYANPAYVLIGAIHRGFGADPLTLLAILAVINALFFIAAARLFFRLHFSEPTVFYILFAMLFLWGRVLWSGTYSLLDGYAYFYPQEMAYSIMLLSLFLLHRAVNRARGLIPLVFTQALLFITHIGTSLYYWVVVLVYTLVFRKRVSRSFALRFGLATVGSFAIAHLWPFYDYSGNVGLFFQRLGDSFGAPETVSIPISIVAFAAVTSSIVQSGLIRRFLPSVLILLPLFGPNARLFLDIFGFGIVGILGLLILIREGKFFLPMWWCAGAILFTFGFIDPTRIILASSFPLYAGAGIVLARFFAKPRKLYEWGFVLAAIIGGDLYFTRIWTVPEWTLLLIAVLAFASILIISLRAARIALPVILLLLLSVPLSIKWDTIRSAPAIEPKRFIEDHVPEWESVLVVEPNKRWMNKVLGGMQNRRGIFIGVEPDSLSFYAEKFGTPFVLFYEVELKGVGSDYEVLAQDHDSALIRLLDHGPWDDPQSES